MDDAVKVLHSTPPDPVFFCLLFRDVTAGMNLVMIKTNEKMKSGRCPMKRLIIIALCITTLTGCSELQIIGKAAFTELNANAINVEMASYRQKDEQLSSTNGKRTVLAMANTKQNATPAKTRKYAKKGLWEGR